MLRAEQILDGTFPVEETLTLPFEQRQKSRLVAQLDGGREILLQLPRGGVLRHGALLRTNEGSVVEVRAARETLSVVESSDPAELARAAYHLGNRHVALQIDQRGLAYLHDHVLDDMLEGLGFSPRVAEAPFEPEHGAYGHAHEHSRPHEHKHGRQHEH
jgi:urease accessory protein